MKVAFRCKRSRNVISFSDENDIESMRKHEGYEEVIDYAVQTNQEAHTDETNAPASAAQEVKRRVRPRKTESVVI